MIMDEWCCRSQFYVLANSLMDLEVGLHKARCRRGDTAEKRRERQNLIPAYDGAGFSSSRTPAITKEQLISLK